MKQWLIDWLCGDTLADLAFEIRGLEAKIKEKNRNIASLEECINYWQQMYSEQLRKVEELTK